MVDDDCAFIQELDGEPRIKLRPAARYCRSLRTADVMREDSREEEQDIKHNSQIVIIVGK